RTRRGVAEQQDDRPNAGRLFRRTAAAVVNGSESATSTASATPYDVSLVIRYKNPRVIALLVMAGVLGLDQISKQWALAELRQMGSTIVLPGPVDLTLVLNRSNAFGLVPVSGELTRWGLAALNLAVAAILAWIIA